MKTEDGKDFGEIKAAILNASFESAAQHGFPSNDFDFPDAVCAKLPRPFDMKGVLQVMDRYTSGNGKTIVSSSGPFCGPDSKEQWIIMPASTARALKANLRTNSPQKATNREEADDLASTARTR